jgi:hypothetical protein
VVLQQQQTCVAQTRHLPAGRLHDCVSSASGIASTTAPAVACVAAAVACISAAEASVTTEAAVTAEAAVASALGLGLRAADHGMADYWR